MNENAKWYRLDNAAKLYPSIKTSRWSSVYRLSVSLTEPIDKALLERAADIALKRTRAFSLSIKRACSGFTLNKTAALRKYMRTCSIPAQIFSPVLITVFYSSFDTTKTE